MLHSISWGELSTHFEPHLASVTREVSQTSVLVCYLTEPGGSRLLTLGPFAHCRDLSNGVPVLTSPHAPNGHGGEDGSRIQP